MEGICRRQSTCTLSPIAWALLELDEIGHVVVGAPAAAAAVPMWRIDVGGLLASKHVISFAIEATARASSHM